MIRKDSGLTRPLPTRSQRVTATLASGFASATSDGFNPASIAGLLLWLRADAGIYTDEAATTQAIGDGDAIGAWRDQSGNERLFVQGTAANQPILKRASINGWPVIRADGTSEYMRLAAAPLDTASGTVFAVFRLTAALQNGQVLLGSADEGSGVRRWSVRSLNTSAVPNISVGQRENDTADEVRGSTAIVAGTAYIGRWASTGTAYVLAVNGSEDSKVVITGADNGDWTGDVTAKDSVTIFAQQINVTSEYMKGDIAELLVYEPALGSADVDAVETYLAGKYGITLA